ncbi:MAG: hypothetical protein RLZZ08_1477 [Pseudomonadota bacterium]|jgi:uncharacterized repeat protein (TIGR01451 family)
MNYANIPIRRLACTAFGLAWALSATGAQAAGIAAGTLIANTATATYDAGGTPETINSNTVTIKVDELLDVTVTSLDAANVPISTSGAVLAFDVTNSGNGAEAFKLQADGALTGDGFDAAISAIAWDSNGNGTYDAGTDTILAPGADTPALAAGASLKAFVITNWTTQPADGALANVKLTARAATGSGTPGTKFAGQGTGGVDAIVGASTALDEDIGRLIARTASVALVKSAVIADPFGGSEPVPGAIVTYSLAATVQGSGTVTGLVVNDTIPTGTTYRPATLKLDGSALTDATGDDSGQASASGISVSVGTVTGGTSHTVSFSVQIQ